jgi:glycosyltransferase involved in cell wall biosynthesis
VTTPTETAALILRSHNIQAPVVPVSCGVDTRRFRPAFEHEQAFLKRSFGFDHSTSIFLYVGRHDCEKRVDLLIRAASLLRQKGCTDIRLVMAGQGAAREQLESLARSCELGQQASFLGFVPSDDLPRLYRAADIFAMPSPEELQSIATLEAMASGKPVLAADSRALPELVTSNVNGLLFTPDDEASAANAMEQLVNHKSGWKRMGWASRSRAVGHSLDATIRQYESLYLRLENVRRKEVGSLSNHRLHTFFTDESNTVGSFSNRLRQPTA